MADEVLNQAAQGQIKSIVERVERLSEEKDALTDHIAEVYAEAKSGGFDVAVLRKVVARRKKDPAKLQEEDAILDLYLSATGSI